MNRKTFIAVLLASFAQLMLGQTAFAQGGGCLSEREVQAAVGSGQILSLNDILQRAGIPRSKLLNFEVCNRGGQLFYQLSVDDGASAGVRVLNAATGRP